MKKANDVQHDQEKTVVEWALQLLVEHYKQDVHVIEEVPPYFDALLGGAPVIPSPVQLWLHRWQKDCLSSASDTTSEQDSTESLPSCCRRQLIMSHALDAYESFIRPALLTISSTALNPNVPELKTTGIPILRNYELLLSKWSIWCHQREKDTVTPMQGDVFIDNRLHLIQLVASDIDLLTSVSTSDNNNSSPSRGSVSKYVLSNVVIPTLMRVLNFQLTELRLLVGNSIDETIRKVLCRCIVTALAFGNPRLGLDHVWPMLFKSFARTWEVHCESLIGVIQPEDGMLPCPDQWWRQCQLDGTQWDDPVVAAAKRQSVACIWTVIFDFLQGDTPNPRCNFSEIGLSSEDSDYGPCCALLGMKYMAEAVRAHLFGRDVINSDVVSYTIEHQAVTQQRTRLHLGHSVPDPRPHPDDASFEKAYRWITSRLHVALQFLCILRQMDVSHELLQMVLPILYELITCPNSTYNAFGAAGLIQILELGHASQRDTSELFSPFTETMLQVLSLAIQTCRESVTLAVLCRAQSIVFAGSRELESCQRVLATQELLVIVARNQHRYVDCDSHMLLWGVLTGGVIPLLNQTRGVEAVEIGRLGLVALLPLLQCSHSSSLLAATLMALNNLMMAAYPIIPHHGGKIMCTLLTCCVMFESALKTQRAENGNEMQLHNCVLVSKLFRHTAALAADLGETRALEMLREIQDEEQMYDDELVKLARDVHLTSLAPEDLRTC